MNAKRDTKNKKMNVKRAEQQRELSSTQQQVLPNSQTRWGEVFFARKSDGLGFGIGTTTTSTRKAKANISTGKPKRGKAKRHQKVDCTSLMKPLPANRAALVGVRGWQLNYQGLAIEQ